MDNQDLKANEVLGRIINILKKVTYLIRHFPFIYLLVYILYLLLEFICSDIYLCFLDTLFYLSPVVFIVLVYLSKVLHMCIWHQTACLFPTLSIAGNYIDNMLFQFTQNEICLIHIFIILVSSLFLIFSYLHFYGLKRIVEANS